jgi:hypothetical protein
MDTRQFLPQLIVNDDSLEARVFTNAPARRRLSPKPNKSSSRVTMDTNQFRR